MNDKINYIRNQNIWILGLTDKVIYHIRTQNYDAALRNAAELINVITTVLEPLLTNISYFNDNFQLYDDQSVIHLFSSLLEAQESKDYVLLADLYEMQLIPFVINLQEKIISKEGYEFVEEYYNSNLKDLKDINCQLVYHLKLLSNPMELLNKGYYIEYASCGLMTLAIEDNRKKYYLHSKYKILYEANTLATSWYSEDKTEYIVYGFGLGYHISELSGIAYNASIEVYESDINVIQLACAFSYIVNIINKPNVKLIYDPDFKQLMKRIGNVNEKTEFVIHYPSLRNVKNITIRENLENYFIQYSSIKNQLSLLNGNFNENILNSDGIVDELKEVFADKDLYIIAAGPSLDKNYEQLKEIGKNGIILATGTVFRKLQTAGITPDYIIVIDGNPRVYKQIAGLENSNVPMLFLSTAFSGFAQKYKGKKYMICQMDFSKAEEFAKKNGYLLYKTGGSVSTTALDIGIRLGCKRIIFLGLDLAFTDNYVHATDTSRRELANTEDLRQVEDINGNMIYTSRNLDIYRKWIEDRIHGIKDIEFIDATEGGAKIIGMSVKKLSDV